MSLVGDGTLRNPIDNKHIVTPFLVIAPEKVVDIPHMLVSDDEVHALYES